MYVVRIMAEIGAPLSREVEDLLYIRLERGTHAGFKTDFLLNRFDNEMCCVSCFGIAQMPTRITTCGHIACKSCLDYRLNLGTPVCPSDNRAFTAQQIQGDAGMARRIGELGVSCPLQARGCRWEGKLKLCYTHLLSCECGPSVISRVSCECCGEELPSGLVLQHKASCPAVLIQCPNQCEVGCIQRSIVSQHLKECPKSVVPCPLQNMGCDFKCLRRGMDSHMAEQVIRHTTLIAIGLSSMMKTNESNMPNNVDANLNERIVRLEERVTNRDNEISLLKAQCKVLADKMIGREHALIPTQPNPLPHSNVPYTYSPFCWVIDDIKGKRANSCEVVSPCVYSAPGGHCIMFKLVANGLGMGRGTHISMVIYQCQGAFDSKLNWPAKFKFTLTVLNQSQDKDHLQLIKQFKFSSPVRPPNATTPEQLVIPDYLLYRDILRASGELHYIREDKISIRILIQSCE